MASVRQLKKKINQQTFQIIEKILLSVGNQNNNPDEVKDFIEDALLFRNKSLLRINNSRGLEQKERRAELKSVEEQLNDKAILFNQGITSA